MPPLPPGQDHTDDDDDNDDDGNDLPKNENPRAAGTTTASAQPVALERSNTHGRHHRPEGGDDGEDQHDHRHHRQQLPGSDQKDRARRAADSPSSAHRLPHKRSKSSSPSSSPSPPQAKDANHHHRSPSPSASLGTLHRAPLLRKRTYRRPPGRAPSGCGWDARRGRWTALLGGSHSHSAAAAAAANRSGSSGKEETANRPKTKGRAAAAAPSLPAPPHSSVSSSRSAAKDAAAALAAATDRIGRTLAPPLRRDARGKFVCPRRQPPTGCVWNADSGQWEVDLTVGTTDTDTTATTTTATTTAGTTTSLIQPQEAKKLQGEVVVDSAVTPAEAAKIRRQAAANRQKPTTVVRAVETRGAVPEQQTAAAARRRAGAPLQKDPGTTRSDGFEGTGPPSSRHRTAPLQQQHCCCCRACEPCRRPACQKCGLCRVRKQQQQQQQQQQRSTSNLNNLVCVLKCCDQSDSQTQAAYCREMEAMLADRSERSLDIGHEVYCCLDGGVEKYVQGTITNKYERGGRFEFTVDIIMANGSRESRKRVPERTICTCFEMQLRTEVDRLKKISGNASKPPATIGFSSNAKPQLLKPLSCQPASVQNAGGTGTLARRSNSQILQKGTRVLALWSGSDYYWGYIVNVIETGLQRRYYDVLFEDGDEKQGVRAEHIATEKQFKDKTGIDPPPAFTPAVWMLADIHRARCGCCSMCQKEECGHCHSCEFNKSSTSKHRRSCILKMCQKVRVLSKALPSRYLRDWKFYSTAPVARPSTTSIRFDPDVSGLRLLAPDGKEYACLEAAMRSFGATEAKSIRAAIQGFANYDLGVPIRRVRDDHMLIGKGYYRVWRDVTGRIVEVYGTITQCLENLCDEGKLFKVKYWDVYRALVNDAATIEDDIPEVDTVSEATATGGYMAFLEKTEPTVCANLSGLPTPISFIVPTSRSDGRDSRDFRFLNGGVQLNFVVKPSLIPNAGEGLFVEATCVERAGWLGSPDAFILKAGVFMDIGIYAPLRKQDRNSFALQQMKSFIFAHKPDSWAFDAKTFDHATLDITDNKTGNLHEEALRSILNRVNETDGTEEPNIYADYDPQGSVHYHLGNSNSGIRLDFGKEIELKIDYGDSYESVRILQNYPRLHGPELTRKKAILARHDEETIRNFFSYSAEDVQDSLLFFEEILEPKWETVELYRQRGMLAALALYGRAGGIQEEFLDISDEDLGNACVNGYSGIGMAQIVERTKSIVRTLGWQIKDKAGLRKKILAYDVLQAVVFKIAQASASWKSADELYDLLCNLK